MMMMMTMMKMLVVMVMVVTRALCEGSGSDPSQQGINQYYPGFTPISENCTQSLIELLLLRQEVHLSRLLDTEIKAASSLTTLTDTVNQLKDALLVRQQAKETLQEECTSPWSVVGDTCLLLAVGERLNWAQSLQFCAARGGRLATYHDANTYAEFLGYISAVNTENAAVDAWIGGTDEAAEGVWQWVTGEAMLKGPPFWGSTNGYKPEPSGGRNENCAILYSPDKYYTHDITCNHKAAPLCQKDLSLMP